MDILLIFITGILSAVFIYLIFEFNKSKQPKRDELQNRIIKPTLLTLLGLTLFAAFLLYSAIFMYRDGIAIWATIMIISSFFTFSAIIFYMVKIVVSPDENKLMFVKYGLNKDKTEYSIQELLRVKSGFLYIKFIFKDNTYYIPEYIRGMKSLLLSLDKKGILIDKELLN